MSLRLPPHTDFDENHEHSSDAETSDSLSEDQDWADWASDSLVKPCLSLFDERSFPSVEETLNYDKSTHGFDLGATCSRISLDFHGRIRLINYIRKRKPSAHDLSDLKGSEPFFTSDEYLLPVVEDDPLLQVQPDDWSDSENGEAQVMDPPRRIQSLERKLALAKQSFDEYRALLSEKVQGLIAGSETGSSLRAGDATPPRDDDTHYFKSYGENDIHAVMIRDKVRTSTYAHFILTNPVLFRDAIVLDVGCGTGILSLFAARSGAKRVIAVDASDIAERAERIVKANGFEDVITVMRGKVEEINLPDDIRQVDIIVSEWMGYALLYESMLDSVLFARDRFLRPGGVMAPSQCKLKLALCDATEIYKDRVGFWGDIYGFDLSVMTESLYNEAIVDVVGTDTLLSASVTIKDLVLSEITPRQLDFSSKFTLVSTAERRTKFNAFVLYFDTFFAVSGQPVPSSMDVKIIKDGEVRLAEIWPAGGKTASQRRRSQGFDKDAVTSFSTGPQSVPTHWKQTLFLLREPFAVADGSIVIGTFFCHKSKENSRELDVEIHFSVKQGADDPPSETVVQMFQVR